ncbi:cilia- and flagella-associated protein 206 [Pycnococcus provasolii]
MSASELVTEPLRAVCALAIQRVREANGVSIEASYAALLANALCTTEPTKYSVHAATPEMRASLASVVAERAMQKDSPATLALFAQATEASARRSEELNSEAERKKMEGKLAVLQAAAVNTRATERSSPAALAKVNEDIRRFVVETTRLEESTDEAESEITTTLQSVVPAHAVGRYLALGKSERREQLNELSHIALGILLYNRALGRGGASIPTTPGEPLSACVALAAELEASAARSRAEMEIVMCVCDARAVAAPPSDASVARMRDEVLNRRQHVGAMGRLQDELKNSAQALRAFEEAMLDEIAALKALVGSRTAVPKDKVYPRFAQLGTLHVAADEEYRRVRGLSYVYEQLAGFETGAVAYTSAATMRDRNEAVAIVRGGGALMCDAAPPAPADPAAAEAEAGVTRVDGATMERLFRGTIDNLGGGEASADPSMASGAVTGSGGGTGEESPLLALDGCDPVCIVLRAGYLTSADLRIGGVKWGGRYYGFVSEENLALFAAQPSDYFGQVMNVTKANPPLCGILRLSSELPACDADEALAAVATPLAREFGTQTPTHFCEKRVDTNYEWNEWALRRKALRLANLRQCVTKSTQSNVSTFRRTSETQVYLPKDSSTQYAVSKGQTMVRPLRYIAGLRGAPDTRMEVVDVGLDVGQPHEL